MQVRALSPRQLAQPQLWLQVTLNLPNALQPVLHNCNKTVSLKKKGNVETAMVVHWVLSLCRAPQGCLSNFTLACAVILLRSLMRSARPGRGQPAQRHTVIVAPARTACPSKEVVKVSFMILAPHQPS